MSKARDARSKKRQLGQFLTPPKLSKSMLKTLELSTSDRILEPSFGSGSFIFALIEKLLDIYPTEMKLEEKLDRIFAHNLFGFEIDQGLYNEFWKELKRRYSYYPRTYNLFNEDFFTSSLSGFDFIIGNPPFGGTIDYKYQDQLDRSLGKRHGIKIKKETYSFFLVKSLDMLKSNGRLIFICSDSFLTIKTMMGLRNMLMVSGQSKVSKIEHFSDETNYGMVVLDYVNGIKSNIVYVNEKKISYDTIKLTKNLSWGIDEKYAKYFSGPMIGDFLCCSSGMTVGKNELFIRKIENDRIKESYDFSFFDDPITLEKEKSRARLNKISESRAKEIIKMEQAGRTRRNVKIAKGTEKIIQLPHPDYKYYNKANTDIFYSSPRYAIYWKNDGEAVYTFKKNGRWYLGGVGGKSFFGRRGITWGLVSDKINARYLPSGYILDSGSPVGILKQGINQGELFFLIGWLLTDQCNEILKNVINHTRNIQGKDIERLPYPFWVGPENKKQVIGIVKDVIKDKRDGQNIDEQKILLTINSIFKDQQYERLNT